MNRKFFYFSILTLVAILVSAPVAFADKIIIRQVSSPEGTAVYEQNIAIAKVVNDKAKGIKIGTTTAKGNVNCMRLVGKKSVDVTYQDMWNLAKMYKNEGAWKKIPQKIKPMGGIWTYSAEFFIFTLAKRDDINCLKDLKGKSWNFGPGGGSAGQAWAIVFKGLGYLDGIAIKYSANSQEPDMLISGGADAILGHTIMQGRSIASRARDLDARAKIKVVTPSDQEWEAIKNMKELAPYYATTTPLTPYSQKLNVKEARAIGQGFGFGIAPYVDVATAYKYVKAVFENKSELQKITKVFTQFKDDAIALNIRCNDAIAKAGIPVHPGAAKYFKEIGIWKSNWIEGKIMK